ncbi:MAG: hypothetical protein FWC89_05520 [Defluviitaleaceae bacterium]|nr:hypothetical protein [Defluviitaleaceae bacterium]
MAGLQMFASYIADNNIEKEIYQEDLDLIQSEVNELITTVADSMIDNKLKKSIIANLNNISILIHEYYFFGSATVNNAIQKTLGQTVLQFSQIEQTEENKNIFMQFLEKMRNINTVISFTSNVQQVHNIVATAMPVLLDKLSS